MANIKRKMSGKTINIPASMEWKYNPNAAMPVMSAQEVQNTVAQNTGTPAVTPQTAAANASLTAPQDMPLSISGMGKTGGRQIVPGGGNYSNVYSAPMERLMNELLNPNGFKYDVNADGLYQQIKDNYLKQGKQAMMDTQGQSAALTGGYGNSYGAMAGQQAYQESLGNLSSTIPELQQLAWQQYQQGQDDKRNNLEALNKLEAQEYARWMDEQQLRLDLYKQFPELMTLEMNAGGQLGVGGPSSSEINRMMDEMMEQKVLQAGVRNGTNNFVYDPNQQMALKDYLDKGYITVGELGKLQADGVKIPGIDTGNFNYFVNNQLGLNTYGNSSGDAGVDVIAGAAPIARPQATSTAGSAKNNSTGKKQYDSEQTNKWVYGK